jgi:cardiolipin synthase
MADAIRSARRYVHVEFYILQADASTDNFFRALEEVRERGVTVRVLLDHWANRGKPFYRSTLRRLDAMGAQWHLMLPVQPLRGKYQRPDLRNHRKLLVVDGDIAFMGSQNVTDSTYNLRKNIRRGLHWVDLMVRLEGPVVGSVNAVFLSDWYSETDELLTEEVDEFDLRQATGDLDCQIVPSGPGFEFENNLRLFLGLMYAAKERIILVSPYFVPDESILNAITTACHRGVEVELFVSEEGDQAMVYHAQRSYYEVLLRAGVRIWMYRKPYILHTKAMTIDDEVAVIGSSNMDMRSFGLNMEISMLVRGEEFVDEMREVEDRYRKLSTELTLEEWLRQPLRSTVLDNLARLTSALQ